MVARARHDGLDYKRVLAAWTRHITSGWTSCPLVSHDVYTDRTFGDFIGMWDDVRGTLHCQGGLGGCGGSGGEPARGERRGREGGQAGRQAGRQAGMHIVVIIVIVVIVVIVVVFSCFMHATAYLRVGIVVVCMARVRRPRLRRAREQPAAAAAGGSDCCCCCGKTAATAPPAAAAAAIVSPRTRSASEETRQVHRRSSIAMLG